MLITAACAALALAAPSQPAPADLLASLPRVQGRVAVEGISSPVSIERDAYGVAVVSGASMHDVVFAQGFVHGQERFFQMDLVRRVVTGRLAEAVGSDGLASDRHYRRYRFGSVADAVVARMPVARRDLLDAYAAGVNAGVGALGAPPPEHAILQLAPEPWAARDAVLVLLGMFDVLHMNEGLERSLGVMTETLPPELVAFLTPMATRFDAPLAGAAAGPGAPIPGPDVLDLRGRTRAPLPHGLVDVPDAMAGSNSWAVAGARTTHGHAIVANDPHLMLSAPGIWHRVQLAWTTGDGGAPRRAAGLGLPGVPGVVIGATEHLAWGFTNTGGDFQDLIVVERDPDDPARYRGPEGFEPFGTIVERIGVRGGADVELRLETTRWGVVTGADRHGRPLVLRWTALDPETVNLDQLALLDARTLEEGVAVARAWRGPSQNVILADTHGRIAWTISGWFPRRVGFDGSVPVTWSAPGVGWDGPQDDAVRPSIVDPPDGVLYTANNRTVGVARARRLGNGWDLGARARRIRDLLREAGRVEESDLLAMQLDARVEVFDFYRDLALDAAAGDRDLAAARDVLAGWDGTADADQAAVRLLDRFRRALHRAVAGPLMAACRAADPSFRYRWHQSEEPVRRLLEARPPHLLAPEHADWDALVRATLRSVVSDCAAPPGLDAPWGAVNRAQVAHPLADGAPAFAAMLNMPDAPLSGHPLAVRVAAPGFGASARMVVSPSRPDAGILHIPAGQSGHPLSPHYRSSHAAWLAGEPTPFLATADRQRLVLTPPVP